MNKIKTLIGLPVLAGACVFAPMLTGAETTIRLGLDQSLSFNDNYRLQPDGEEISGYVLTPKAEFKIEQERLRFEADLEADFGRFSDQPLDSDDQQVDLLAAFKSERSELQFTAGMERDSTRTSEAFSTDIVDVFATRRVVGSAGASWSRSINPRNRLNVGAGYRNVHYDNLGFSDYDYSSAYVGWTWVVSQTSSLQATLSASRFESTTPAFFNNAFEPSLTDSDTVDLNLAYSRALTERWTSSVSLGARQTDTETSAFGCIFQFGNICLAFDRVEQMADSSGFIGSLEFGYRGEQFNAKFGGTRSVTPSGISLLLEQTQYFWNFDWRLAERLTLILQGRYSDGEDVDGQVFDRQVLRAGPRVRWRFARNWTLESGYQYANRESFRLIGVLPDGSPDANFLDEDSNEIFMNLRYWRDPMAF